MDFIVWNISISIYLSIYLYLHVGMYVCGLLSAKRAPDSFSRASDLRPEGFLFVQIYLLYHLSVQIFDKNFGLMYFEW